MTSRERVLSAIKGEKVDQTPVMIWLNPHMTCRLLAEKQIAGNIVTGLVGKSIWRRFLRRGEMDADALTRALPFLFEEYGNGELALKLGSDIAVLSPDFISPSSFIRNIRLGKNKLEVSGPFGGRVSLAGIYMHPLLPAVDHPKNLKYLELPEVNKNHFSGVRAFRKKFPGACLLVEIGAMQQVLCDYILGSEAFMLALYDYPKEIADFMQRLGDWLYDIIPLASDAGADIIFLQDDYGCNMRPLISMKMWRELTFPQLCRLVQASHKCKKPFMLHSCGFQMPFLKYYLEAQIDVLQSLQTGAGNDLSLAIQNTFGKLAFATGIDVQQAETLNTMDFSASMRKVLNTGRNYGKFIFATTHMMQHSLSKEILDEIFLAVLNVGHLPLVEYG